MPKKVNEQPESSDLGPDYFEVQSILDRRQTSRGPEYLIRWKNFPNPRDFTWEPTDHLEEVKELLDKFNEELEEKKKRKKEKEEKMKKKVEEQNRFELQEQEQEEEEEEIQEVQEPKKRGRKKGTTIKKDQGRYMPKIVKTEVSQPKKREKKMRKSESQEEIRPVQKRKIKEDQGQPSPVIITSSKSEYSQRASQKWYLTNSLRLGSIYKHHFSRGSLFYLVNVENKEGELICLTAISDAELSQLDKEKVREYLLSYFYGVSRAQKGQNQLSQCWKAG